MKNNNDVFSIHDIEHLSPSSINSYIDDPCIWIMRYLFKFRNGGGPAMWRGTVTDHGVGKYFGFTEKPIDLGETIQSALFEYQVTYDNCKSEYPTQEINHKKFLEEADRIPRYIKTAIDFYEDLGQPTEYQKRIELNLESIPVPIIGFIDLKYNDTIRDIKTTARRPYKVSDAHARQVSVYAKAEDCVPILDYIVVTAKDEQVVSETVHQVDKHIHTVEQVALKIMNLLSYSNDKHEIANLFYPNLDDWKWGAEEIKFAKTIWSIK